MNVNYYLAGVDYYLINDFDVLFIESKVNEIILNFFRIHHSTTLNYQYI
jgi:hypothetical protein